MQYIIGIVVIIALAVGYSVFFQEKPAENTPATNQSETMEDMDMSSSESSDGLTDAELEGIHIMGNGAVMLKDGTVLEDATITADGMIELSGGRQVEPTADYRQ